MTIESRCKHDHQERGDKGEWLCRDCKTLLPEPRSQEGWDWQSIKIVIPNPILDYFKNNLNFSEFVTTLDGFDMSKSLSLFKTC